MFTNMSSHVSQDLKDAIANMSLMKDPKSTADIYGMAANSLVTGLKTVARIILNIVGDLLSGFVDLLKKLLKSKALSDWLNGSVQIPFITDLYCYVTGKDKLTAIDLAAFLCAVPGVFLEAFKGEKIFKKANPATNDDDPRTVAAAANVFQMFGGVVAAYEDSIDPQVGRGPILKFFFLTIARITYAKAILMTKTGDSLVVAMVTWALPTLNLLKDIGFKAGGFLPREKAFSDALSCTFGICCFIMLIPAFDPDLEISAATVVFVFIVATSLAIAPLPDYTGPPVSFEIKAARGLLVAISGVVGLVANVADFDPGPALA